MWIVRCCRKRLCRSKFIFRKTLPRTSAVSALWLHPTVLEVGFEIGPRTPVVPCNRFVTSVRTGRIDEFAQLCWCWGFLLDPDLRFRCGDSLHHGPWPGVKARLSVGPDCVFFPRNGVQFRAVCGGSFFGRL